MAKEGKEKKRKAAAETPSADAPKKKHKKSKNKKETTHGAGPAKPIETPAASEARAEITEAVSTQGNSPTLHTNVRKRAVDFLSEDEDDPTGGTKLPTEATGKDVQHDSRPSKKSKKQKKAEKLTDPSVPNIEQVERTKTVSAGGQDSETVKKAAHFTEDGKENSRATVEKATEQSAPKKKQRGPTVSDVMADRFQKLISTDPSQWNLSGKKKKQKKLSANSVIDDDVHKQKEQNGNNQGKKVTEQTKNSASTALQAEAQGSNGENEELPQQQEEDIAPELLTGFDSDGADDKEDDGLDAEAQSFTLPDYKKTNKLLRKAAEKGSKDGPGTVYIGRIPHGFYEHQMRAYFSQFGDVTKLRLSRNRKTGASKHFAFIQFESAEVAKIVAQTMDNYLMFGHILKCKFAPEETLHPDVWKGANRRYRNVPHNKIEGKWLASPKSKEYWATKTEKEQRKREAKAEKLKELGYEIELVKMDNVDDVQPQKKMDTPAEQPLANAASTAGKVTIAEPSSEKAKEDHARGNTDAEDTFEGFNTEPTSKSSPLQTRSQPHPHPQKQGEGGGDGGGGGGLPLTGKQRKNQRKREKRREAQKRIATETAAQGISSAGVGTK